MEPCSAPARTSDSLGLSQRVGINTFVPPHTDIETFGSDPERAMRYGTEEAAISCDGSPHIVNAYHYYRTRGFRLVDEGDGCITYF